MPKSSKDVSIIIDNNDVKYEWGLSYLATGVAFMRF